MTKPRLSSVPLTHEDNMIWTRNVVRWCCADDPGQLSVARFHRDTIGADRCDADLMWWAQLRPRHYGAKKVIFNGHILEDVLVRGSDGLPGGWLGLVVIQ